VGLRPHFFLRHFFSSLIIDGFVKSPFCPIFVIPAKAGIQVIQLVLSASGGQRTYNYLKGLDSGFRRNDRKAYLQTFYEIIILD
jgi:hypothetical protein